MKKHYLFILIFLTTPKLYSQIKFGARSGVGIYFDTFNANILGSKDDQTFGSSESLLGNPLPRANDYENGKVYTDFGFSQEVFAKWGLKNEISFSFTYIKKPRAYNDLAELYWGENEDHREIYYQLVYSRKYWEKKKLSLQLGTGIAVNKLIVSRAVYSAFLDQNGNIDLGNFGFYTSGNDPKQFDWGFPLKVQFNYNINSNAALGLQSNFIYLFQLGINHITLTPTLQISF
jgi:hypothetical protein